MNYYNDPTQPPQQLGYTIVLGGPNPQQGDQGPPQQQKLDPKIEMEYHRARWRNMHAGARPSELNIILDSMKEIRSAVTLQSMQVSSPDSGGTDRPPLEPAFDIINRGKLQHCYLRLAERLVNYTEQMMEKQLEITMTNEINKMAKESKPVDDASTI